MSHPVRDVFVGIGRTASPSSWKDRDEMQKFMLAAAVALGVAGSHANAGWFRRHQAVAVCTGTSCPATTTQQAKPAAQPAVSGNTSTAQGVALLIVQTGRFRHWGNPAGGFEGIGMGGSPAQALANCCFYGKRQIVDVGYAQMSNGQWVAVARYR